MAASVIRQAAEDIRRGRPANIAIVSTDIENGSAYSRALSTAPRRGDPRSAGKEGVSPAQVDIAAAGEVPPLTPVAGGIAPRPDETRAQITF